MSPRAKRAAAGHLIETMGISKRFACAVVGLGRSTFAAPHPDQTPCGADAGYRTWLCAYAKKHPWGATAAPTTTAGRRAGGGVDHKKTQQAMARGRPSCPATSSPQAHRVFHGR